ncbi:hypothetical protein YTPLAS21_19490 [Candidatus Nitrosocosmicus sp.]|nr:hypothetical protein YTPLAS21_19490 [Candidatus Nitrosocosmicus sp.]
MTLEQVIIEFGSGARLCKLLKIHRQNFTYWKKIGYIPIMAQYRIQDLSEGKLKASFDDLPGHKNYSNPDK